MRPLILINVSYVKIILRNKREKKTRFIRSVNVKSSGEGITRYQKSRKDQRSKQINNSRLVVNELRYIRKAEIRTAERSVEMLTGAILRRMETAGKFKRACLSSTRRTLLKIGLLSLENFSPGQRGTFAKHWVKLNQVLFVAVCSVKSHKTTIAIYSFYNTRT